MARFLSHGGGLLLVLVSASLLSSAGCARLSHLRQRLSRNETTVPLAGLSPVPARKNDRVPAMKPPSRPLAGLSPRRALPGLGWQQVGRSVDGRPIESAQLGAGPMRVLFVGGIHGDEPEGLSVTERFAEEVLHDRTVAQAMTLLIIRDLNPDGTAARTRTNSNGVDLNRNFPASNWDSTASQPRFNPGPRAASEPETQLLIDIIHQFRPDRILVMHATRGEPMVNYDGPARELAESMSRLNGYITTDTIGYPTPGSLGSYAGVDMRIPIITLELPRGITAEAAWDANHLALRQMLR